jgi:hypothetical protein
MGYTINYVIESIDGHPCVLEKKPICVARIPVRGDALEDSVLIHPRYVPKEIPHEIISVRGYRRGRALYVLLETPLEINGKKYNFLDFKGAGANADRELVIHPTHMFINRFSGGFFKGVHDVYDAHWVPREIDHFHRVWGGLKYTEGRDEYSDPVLMDNNVPASPHVHLNHLPRRVCERITKLRSITGRRPLLEQEAPHNHRLTQLVRASVTNIRMSDVHLLKSFNARAPLHKYATEIAVADAAFMQFEIDLTRSGRELVCIGDIADNRYIDGLFTDEGNYAIRDECQDKEIDSSSCVVLNDSLQFIKRALLNTDDDNHKPFIQYYNTIDAALQFDVIPELERCIQSSRAWYVYETAYAFLSDALVKRMHVARESFYAAGQRNIA